MSLTNSTWSGIIKLFPARESLVSDILARDGKRITFFYSVCTSSEHLYKLEKVLNDLGNSTLKTSKALG
jgi:hypothetical protein